MMTKPTTVPQLVYVRTAAQRLKVPQAVVLDLCEEHGVTVYQFGKTRRVRESDLVRVLMSCRRLTERELAGRLDASYRLAEAELLGESATASPGSPDGLHDDAGTSE